jgi:hypothetical protein
LCCQNKNPFLGLQCCLKTQGISLGQEGSSEKLGGRQPCYMDTRHQLPSLEAEQDEDGTPVTCYSEEKAGK